MTTINYSDGRTPITFDCERIDEVQTVETVGDVLNKIPPYVLFKVELVQDSSYTREDLERLYEIGEKKKGVKGEILKLLKRNAFKVVYCTWGYFRDNFKQIFDSSENIIQRNKIHSITFEGVKYIIKNH